MIDQVGTPWTGDECYAIAKIEPGDDSLGEAQKAPFFSFGNLLLLIVFQPCLGIQQLDNLTDSLVYMI